MNIYGLDKKLIGIKQSIKLELKKKKINYRKVNKLKDAKDNIQFRIKELKKQRDGSKIRG